MSKFKLFSGLNGAIIATMCKKQMVFVLHASVHFKIFRTTNLKTCEQYTCTEKQDTWQIAKILVHVQNNGRAHSRDSAVTASDIIGVELECH